METFLIKEQYKIIRLIRLEEHFAAVHAVDVTSRSNEQYILNIYDGELVKKYVGQFNELHNCPDYVGMFVRDESLVVVFKYSDGKPIDQCYYLGDNCNTGECVFYADRLFKETLAVSDFPPMISCAMLMSEQVRLRKTERDFVLRPVIVPVGEVNERELVLLLKDHIQKILHVRFTTASSVRRYLRELDEITFKSVVQMYSHWCARKPEMEAEEAKFENMAFIPKIIGLIGINVKDFLYNLVRKNKEVRL